MAMHVKGLKRYVVLVLTAVKLVARFWRFVKSVLTTQKPVRRMYTLVESDLTAARLVGVRFHCRKSLLAACIGSWSQSFLWQCVWKYCRGLWSLF